MSGMSKGGGPTHGSAPTRSEDCGFFWSQEAELPDSGKACASGSPR